VLRAARSLEAAIELQRQQEAAGIEPSKLFGESLDAYEEEVAVASGGRFEAFTMWQRQGIRALALEMQDLVLVRKTGEGKSFVFWSAAQLRGGLSLLIAPLNVIVQSHAAAARAAGVRPVVVTAGAAHGAPDGKGSVDPGGGKDAEGMVWLEQQLAEFCATGEMPRPVCILAHPEAATAPPMLAFLRRAALAGFVQLLGLDEAGVMLGWGASFRPAFWQLHLVRKALGLNVPACVMDGTTTNPPYNSCPTALRASLAQGPAQAAESATTRVTLAPPTAVRASPSSVAVATRGRRQRYAGAGC
jgi:superfamily II DNA helicase RecQ